jgi:hypothetical protein
MKLQMYNEKQNKKSKVLFLQDNEFQQFLKNVLTLIND